MRVLVACERSGRVRDALLARGHEAISCDVEPTDVPGPHIQADVLEVLGLGWDLMIGHPPCTYLARSGMRWLKDQPPLNSGKPVGAERRQLLREALLFFERLWYCGIPRICLENPKSFLIPITETQVIQPWQFGHGETKATALWLRNLPPLVPTAVVPGRDNRIHRMPPGPDRARERSLTYPGVAEAMAAQWGAL